MTAGSAETTAASAHVAGVAEGVRPRLWPHREPVRLAADGDGGEDGAAGRIDGVDDTVVPPTQPKHPAVDADVAHVRAPAAGDRPRGDELLGGEVEHRHRA